MTPTRFNPARQGEVFIRGWTELISNRRSLTALSLAMTLAVGNQLAASESQLYQRVRCFSREQ